MKAVPLPLRHRVVGPDEKWANTALAELAARDREGAVGAHKRMHLAIVPATPLAAPTAPANEPSGVSTLTMAPLVPAVVLDARTRGAGDRVRAVTISVKRLSQRTLERDRLIADAMLAEVAPSERTRPATRAGCEGGERPCPYVSCKYHLYLDVSETTGAIKLNFPHLEVWELPESCALDVADNEGMALEATGAVTNLTRERIRQIETRAKRDVRAELKYQQLTEGDLEMEAINDEGREQIY